MDDEKHRSLFAYRKLPVALSVIPSLGLALRGAERDQRIRLGHPLLASTRKVECVVPMRSPDAAGLHVLCHRVQVAPPITARPPSPMHSGVRGEYCAAPSRQNACADGS